MLPTLNAAADFYLTDNTPTVPVVLVRLRGLDSTEGRVEVQYEGLWGTICFNDFDYVDALVICKQLGKY